MDSHLIVRPRPGDVLAMAGFIATDVIPDTPEAAGLPADVLGPLPFYVDLAVEPTGDHGLVLVRFGYGVPLVGTPPAEPNPYAVAWREAEREVEWGPGLALPAGPSALQVRWGVDWAEDFDPEAFRKLAYGDFSRMVVAEHPQELVLEPTHLKTDGFESLITYQPSKQSYLLEFFAYEQMGEVIAWGSASLDHQDEAQANLLAWAAHPESAVDIAYWFYREAALFYSIRRAKDNFYYDFATKRFSLLPASPRAMLPRQAATPGVPGILYHTKLSGHLDDGEYIVVVRDGEKDVMVGAMCLYMRGGAQVATPPVGLEDQPLEEGLPGLTSKVVRSRRVRRVET